MESIEMKTLKSIIDSYLSRPTAEGRASAIIRANLMSGTSHFEEVVGSRKEISERLVNEFNTASDDLEAEWGVGRHPSLEEELVFQIHDGELVASINYTQPRPGANNVMHVS